MIPPLTKEAKMLIADSVGAAEQVDPIANDASTP
jgi:hypothetical protein